MVRLAVFDPLPMYRRGVMATLGDAAFEPETAEALLAWLHEEHRPVVIMTLQSESDWSLLSRLNGARPDCTIVAVMTDTSVNAYVHAILAGAVTVVPRDALAETIRDVLDAAVSDRSVLPIEVVRALATPHGILQDKENVSAREIGWLRELAHGATVAQLAERVGYSERAMFRMLRELYVRIGVRNRTQAMIRAKELGWL